jgi:hypothetical protein
VREVLKWTTCLLLAGHGALGAFSGKPMLSAHYAAIGLPAVTTVLVGWFELALAVAVAVRPAVGVLLFVTLWKLATESLFVVAGDPIWEVLERAGSYAAPLALAVLLTIKVHGKLRHPPAPTNALVLLDGRMGGLRDIEHRARAPGDAHL